MAVSAAKFLKGGRQARGLRGALSPAFLVQNRRPPSPQQAAGRPPRLCVAAAAIFCVAIGTASAQPRVDNVLIRMVPPGTTSLVGVHMDQVKQTEIYKKMLASQNLGQVDQFAAETGFDPRRDVRELLFASSATGQVMLARGTFHIHADRALSAQAKKIRHGDYTITASRTGGFCVLDSSLAVAGDVSTIEAALDEWKTGAHGTAQPLLARAGIINQAAQFWGVSTGAANFLAQHPPAIGAGAGLDFSKIFSGMQDTWFQADLSTGLRSEVHGVTATEKDAMNLRDAVRGIVGLGRLNVPDNQPDLLKVWDGITVDQQGKSISVKADIPQDLFDKMIGMLSSGASRIPRKLL